ncbi:unnamed protein product [Mytilus edulis]|uniref:THAP-type domain-containing protein n=1 Tax=Mytilus edulis TaxID=6550 RepID=A0A8S3RAW1_MYTED|nr:unnamed protein product [Mytilus edulis]
MGGQDHCCIVNCTNRRSSMPKGFAFHRIPAVPITRRNAWIKASGRQLRKNIGELTVTEHTKVCGAHFTTGRKSKDPTHIDYVPTLNLPIQSKSTPQRFTTRSRRAMEYEFAISEATLVKKKTFAKSGKVLFPIDINDVQHEVVIESESACTRNVEHLTNTVRKNCEVTPIDHDYHMYWIGPVDNYKESSSQTCNENTDNFSQTIPDTSCTVTASI